MLLIMVACPVYVNAEETEQEVEESPKIYYSGGTKITITGETMTVSPNTSSGKGAMDYYYWNVSSVPWVNDREDVKKLIIEDGVTGLGMHVFEGMNNLEEVKIGKDITSIPWGSFAGTTSLTSIDIPSTVTHIGESAFSGSGLTSVVIPDSVTKIDLYAFHTTPLTSLVIPDNMSIGGQSFRNVQLKEITASADQLKRYFDAYGSLAGVDDVKIICTSGDCKKVLQEYGTWEKPFAAYVGKVIYPKIKNNDGSYTLFDNNGNIVGFEGKRIYTVEEANMVSGQKNTIKIRYK